KPSSGDKNQTKALWCLSFLSSALCIFYQRAITICVTALGANTFTAEPVLKALHSDHFYSTALCAGLAIPTTRKTSPGVSDVTLVEKEPADRHAIVSWEQKNACILPEDLKNFYLMTDGFQMTWSVKIDGKSMCLSQLIPLYLADNSSFAESL
uniref:TPGS2 n=1 Tax=Pavo cristatus TaxID=9049 RepID=A0A8C9F8A9_PAVCR